VRPVPPLYDKVDDLPRMIAHHGTVRCLIGVGCRPFWRRDFRCTVTPIHNPPTRISSASEIPQCGSPPLSGQAPRRNSRFAHSGGNSSVLRNAVPPAEQPHVLAGVPDNIPPTTEHWGGRAQGLLNTRRFGYRARVDDQDGPCAVLVASPLASFR